MTAEVLATIYGKKRQKLCHHIPQNGGFPNSLKHY